MVDQVSFAVTADMEFHELPVAGKAMGIAPGAAA